MAWYEHLRKTEASGGSAFHKGELQLVEWEFEEQDGAKLGWGAVYLDEVEDLKKSFEDDYKKDYKLFFEYWPGAFRWTCW